MIGEREGTSGPFFQNVEISVIEQGFRPFAKCLDYSLTTNRDTIDVTVLGEQFHKQWESGLIGGQGTVTAIWDEAVVMAPCGDPYVATQGDEVAAYFAKLILRIQIGAGFRGKFFLRRPDPEREPEEDRPSVYWQADCVCTSVAVEATPDAFLRARIEFVTTGIFQLEIRSPDATDSLETQTGLLLEREGDAGLLLLSAQGSNVPSPTPTPTPSP